MTPAPLLRRLFCPVAFAAGLCGLAPAQAALIVSDAVESTGGWSVSGNGIHFLNACCGTGPTAGSQYLHIQNIGGRDASKSFAGVVLQAGTYTVTFDMGSFNNAPFANISQIGLTAGGSWLTASQETNPVPAAATVTSWTEQYTIGSSDSLIGQTIGFRLLAANSGQNRNASFDNLRIDFVAAATAVPEPASLALVAIALGALGARRARHHIVRPAR